jgi:hypothetical protein
MHLNEFAWAKEESPAEGENRYQGGETLDCQIGITPDGKFEIRNHVNPEESESYDTPEEAGEALTAALKSRVS